MWEEAGPAGSGGGNTQGRGGWRPGRGIEQDWGLLAARKGRDRDNKDGCARTVWGMSVLRIRWQQ